MGKHEDQDYLMSSGAYNALKPTVQMILPGLGALYFTLAQIWGLPKAEEIVGTIAALTTFLGVLLAVATKSYNGSEGKYDGTIHVEKKEDGTKSAAMVLKNYENPAEVVQQDEVRFKVQSHNVDS